MRGPFLISTSVGPIAERLKTEKIDFMLSFITFPDIFVDMLTANKYKYTGCTTLHFLQFAYL